MPRSGDGRLGRGRAAGNPTHLVDLAMAGGGGARPAGGAEGGRPQGAARDGREGRPGCPADGGNAAARGKRFASAPIGPNGSRKSLRALYLDANLPLEHPDR